MVVDTFSIELNANIYIFLPIPFSNLLYKYFRITRYCVLRILEQKYISKCFDSMVKLIKMSESREKWSSLGGSDYRLLANLKPKIRSGPDECPICCLGMGGPLLESRVWCSNRCHARPKCERAFPMFQMEPSGGKFFGPDQLSKQASWLTLHQLIAAAKTTAMCYRYTELG